MLDLPDAAGDVAGPTLGLSLGFEIKQEKHEGLARFVDGFAHGKDQCAHMVVYRPMRSDPKQLMKSFLAISPPKRISQDKSSFVFTHVYQPPRATGNDRIGSGKIIPLDDGLYFVGGQRPRLEGHQRGRNHSPFSSMKIIALRWIDVNAQHPLMPAIALSTNYSGTLISSRVAMRITPIQDHRHINLRSVACEDLVENLKHDLDVEREAIRLVEESKSEVRHLWHPENSVRFKTEQSDEDLAELAMEISKIANNAPNAASDWRVPDGFVRTSRSRSDTLDDDELMAAIASSLKGRSGATYERDGEAFRLWSHIRMAPIQID